MSGESEMPAEAPEATDVQMRARLVSDIQDALVDGDQRWVSPVSYTHLTLPTIYSV